MKSQISTTALLETLGERYATKQFDSTKQISDTDMYALCESLRLAPSSFGLQPWKFIVVKNPAVRKELRAAAWNQSQVEEASHFVVFATLKQVDPDFVKKYIASTAEIRGISPEDLKGYEDMMINFVTSGSFEHLPWTQRQSYIAMGFLGLSAALLGIDTCMMEWLDPKAFNTILGLENGPYTSVAAVALGYRSEADATSHYAKSRFTMDEVVEVI